LCFFFPLASRSRAISRPVRDPHADCAERTQGLITAGLLSSPAARASFLTQTSVVLTPLISAMAGERIAPSVWGGCGIALLGLFLISTSGGTPAAAAAAAAAGAGAAATSFNRGDAMILLGALSWSAYILRTSRLAGSYGELDLQFAKTALLAVMYGAWFALDARSALLPLGAAGAGGTAAASSGGWEALTSLWPGWDASPMVWSLLVYSAVGPGAIADLLQQRGQRGTSASESNVILTMESVFAAACAYAFLGEVSSVGEVAGGGLIVIAAILASR
jgi:drug/metabolite transporter (DMT)-like permease